MDNLDRRRALGIALAASAVTIGVAHAQSVELMDVEARIRAAGIQLPLSGPAPVANYIPVRIHGNVAYVAGQIPFTSPGKLLFTGRAGAELTLEQMQASTRLVGLNMLALLKSILGSLDRITGVLRVDGFLSSSDSFFQQPQAMNGFSDLMVEVFGEAGKHARTAVGVNVLPLNAPCEIDAEFSLHI